MLFLLNMIFLRLRSLVIVLLLFFCFSISIEAAVLDVGESSINFPPEPISPTPIATTLIGTKSASIRAGDEYHISVSLKFGTNVTIVGNELEKYVISLYSIPEGGIFREVTSNSEFEKRYYFTSTTTLTTSYEIVAAYSLKGGNSPPVKFDSIYIRVDNSKQISTFTYTITPTNTSNISEIEFVFKDIYDNIVNTAETEFDYKIDYLNVGVTTKDLGTYSSVLTFHSSSGPFVAQVSADYAATPTTHVGTTTHSYIPDRVPNSPLGVTASFVGDDNHTVEVTWTDNSDVEEEFKIFLKEDTDNSFSQIKSIANRNGFSGSPLSVNISSTPNSRFTLYVSAENTVGSGRSEVIQFHMPPSKVEDSSVMIDLYSNKSDTVKLTWALESSTNHINTLYRVNVNDNSNNQIYLTTTTASRLEQDPNKVCILITISAFSSETRYTFSVATLYDSMLENSWSKGITTLESFGGEQSVATPSGGFAFFEKPYRENLIDDSEGAEFNFKFPGDIKDVSKGVLLNNISTKNYTLSGERFLNISDDDFEIYDNINYSTGTVSYYSNQLPASNLFASVKISSDAKVEYFESSEEAFAINFSTGRVSLNIPSSYSKSMSVKFSSTSVSDDLLIYVPLSAFADDVKEWVIIPSTLNVSEQISTQTISLLYSSAIVTSLSFELKYSTDPAKAIKISRAPQLRISTGVYEGIMEGVSMSSYSLSLLRYSDSSEKWLPYKSSVVKEHGEIQYYAYNLDTLNGVYELYLVQGNSAPTDESELEKVQVYSQSFKL